MKKSMSWFTEKLAPAINDVFANPWLASVVAAMQRVLPFILVGSLISIYNVFVRYIPSLPDFGFVNTFSFGMMSLIVAFMVAYYAMMELKHEKYSIIAGLTSISAFLMALLPNLAQISFNEVTGANQIAITNMSYLGGSGLFIAIIIGLFVAVVFNVYASFNFFENSTSMPDFVGDWINNIVPITVILFVIGVFVINLNFDLVDAVNWLFQPVVNLGQSLAGFLIISFLYVFLYSLGISAWSLNAIVKPILVAGISANADLVAAGMDPINIVTTETIFTTALIAMGGLRGTLPLNFLMIFSCYLVLRKCS